MSGRPGRLICRPENLFRPRFSRPVARVWSAPTRPTRWKAAVSGIRSRRFCSGISRIITPTKMQEYLERHVAVRRVGDYYKWDGATGGYTRKVMSNGVNYPISQDVPVISVMAAMSVTNLDLNMIYPPIGPYHGNLIRTFDPRVLADREAARKVFSPKGGCDFTLKIIQGGLEHFYLLPASAVEENNPQKLRNLMTAAVNLMAAPALFRRLNCFTLLRPTSQVYRRIPWCWRVGLMQNRCPARLIAITGKAISRVMCRFHSK